VKLSLSPATNTIETKQLQAHDVATTFSFHFMSGSLTERNFLWSGANLGSAPNTPSHLDAFLKARIASLYAEDDYQAIAELFAFDAADANESAQSSRWDFLKHLTISRDQTHQSTFDQE